MVLLLLLVLFGTTCLGKDMDHKHTTVTAKETNVAFANTRRILSEDRFTRTLPSVSLRPRTGRQSLDVLGHARRAQTKARENVHLESSQAIDREKQADSYASETTPQKQPDFNHVNNDQPTDLEKQAGSYTSETTTQKQPAFYHENYDHTDLEKQAGSYTGETPTQKQPTFNHANYDQPAELKHKPVINSTKSDNSADRNQEKELHNRESEQDFVKEQEQIAKYVKPSQITLTEELIVRNADPSHISKDPPLPTHTDSSNTVKIELVVHASETNLGETSSAVAQQQQVFTYTDSDHEIASSPPAVGSEESGLVQSERFIAPEAEQEQSLMDVNHNIYQGQQGDRSAEVWHQQQEMNNNKSAHTMSQEQPGSSYTQSSQTMTQEQSGPTYTKSSQTRTQEQSGPTYTHSRQTMTQEQPVPNYTQSRQSKTQVQSMPSLAESSQTTIPEQQESKDVMSNHTTEDDRQPLSTAPTSPTENPRRLFHNQSVIPESASSLNILFYKSQHSKDVVSPGSDQTQKKLNFAFSVSNSANDSRKAQMDTLPCLVFELGNDTIANCSFRNIHSLPIPGIPNTVTKLYAQGNFITKMPNNSFENYTLLRILDLSRNKLSKLEELTFCGLKQLKLLNLSDNNLTMSNSTFPENVFRSLIRLEELYLNKNNKDCKATGANYPDKALSHLTSLNKLCMDGMFDIDFGPGFQNLTSLVDLSMGGYTVGCCNMSSLTNLTFQYLTHLKRLNISNCYIPGRNLHQEAFSPLQNLESLDLSHNEDIDIDGLDKVFYSLRNITTLRKLWMRLIVNRYSLGICLDSNFIRNFPQHLEYFDAQENNLEGLDRQVIGLLSPSLKTLDVSGNRFVFGTYLQDLHLMKNLTNLKLNGGGFVYRLPDRFPFQKYLPGGGPNCTLYGGAGEFRDTYSPFIVRLPPNLESIEMNGAGLTYVLSNLTINETNTLKNLSMNKNTFPWLEGTFVGLNHLEYLDVSSSYVGKISPQFFINLTTLETLKLGENLLGDFFSNEASPLVFSHLENLKHLDLSFNDIRNLSRNVFSGLNNLQTLLLKKNPFSEFDVDISHMSNLSLLNLTRSKVFNLPDSVRQHIDKLVRRGQKVEIDMSQCPIQCTCQNLGFLIWIKTSGVVVNDNPGYLCIYDDSSSKYINDGYNSTIEDLTKKCGSNTVLFLCVAGAMVLLFCIIICSVLYRFRWKLRYLYYAAHMFYRSAKRAKEITEFEYDAFISYDEADDRFVIGKMAYELEKRGLKLCIHGRDFRAGEYIASNIVRAVCASRRTVVVLTRNMISSYWCKYEIQMANMEAVYTGRRVLLFLLMETIPDDALGVELLYYIRNSTYIPYPKSLPDATSIGKLWDKLVADIRD